MLPSERINEIYKENENSFKSETARSVQAIVDYLDEQYEKNMPNNTGVKCSKEYCDTPKSPVTFAPDPFASEIGGDVTPIWECEECRRDSALSI